MNQVTVFTDKEIIVADIMSMKIDGVYLKNIKSNPYTNYRELFISNRIIKVIAWHTNDASEMCKLGFVKPFERIDKKARSIVAMLFWDWRKALREADESGASYEFSYGDYWYIEAKEKAFRQAHKMLKDNQ